MMMNDRSKVLCVRLVARVSERRSFEALSMERYPKLV